MSELQNVWKKCSSCKKPILCGSTYYICSVSTCNGQRTGYAFCGMQCFESHLPGARHRDAGAVEKKAPMTPAPAAESSDIRTPSRIIVKSTSAPAVNNKLPQEILVIASRLKEYIQARADFNTSASVMDVLSEHLRRMCDEAVDHARSEGRKTVLDRDFEFLKNLK